MVRNIWSNFVHLVTRVGGLTRYRDHHFYPGVLGRDAFVLDLGVHKGEFSRFITSEYGCSVLGLEANPQLYGVLPALARARFLNLAICPHDRPVTFYVSENPEASSVFEEAAKATGSHIGISVGGITLDSLINNNKIGFVDLLKVDIESAEFEMLNMACEETLSKISQITVEFHVREGSKEFSSERVRTICQRLGRLGFQTFVMDRNFTDVLFLNTKRIRWRFAERLAMVVYRFLIMPVRFAMSGKR